MSVMTAMPLKHVSLSSVREGGRDLSPERCAVSCVLFPAPCRFLARWQGALRGDVGLALAYCPSLLHA